MLLFLVFGTSFGLYVIDVLILVVVVVFWGVFFLEDILVEEVWVLVFSDLGLSFLVFVVEVVLRIFLLEGVVVFFGIWE